MLIVVTFYDKYIYLIMTSCSHMASGTLANIGLKAFIQQHAFKLIQQHAFNSAQWFHFYDQPNNQSLAVG